MVVVNDKVVYGIKTLVLSPDMYFFLPLWYVTYNNEKIREVIIF